MLPNIEEIPQIPESEQHLSDHEDETPTEMHTLTEEQKKRLQDVVAIFPSCEREVLGKTGLIKHAINVGSARPTKQRYHAVSPAIERKMYEEVDRMFKLGVVELSYSAWNSPVTCVTKGNGKTRFCLDARKVNAETVKDAYPMPLIDSILSRLNETRFISSIDLNDAFLAN